MEGGYGGEWMVKMGLLIHRKAVITHSPNKC